MIFQHMPVDPINKKGEVNSRHVKSVKGLVLYTLVSAVLLGYHVKWSTLTEQVTKI